jgi:uncharacterized protein (DUF58 family)
VRVNIRGFFQRKYNRFIESRLESRPSITLTQKRIYIFPGRIGAFYFVLVALMFITAINYQNNLIFSFSCLLISVFITAIAFTYKNLSGLKIAAGNCEPVFEGQKATIKIDLSVVRGDARQGVSIGFNQEDSFELDTIGSSLAASLSCLASKRGLLDVPRFTLFSHYPLGLLRCWTWVKLDFKVLVYPKANFKPFKKSGSIKGDEPEFSEVTQLVKGQTADDFYGFKTYQPGDSLKHVAWRQYAKTGQLLTKEFSSIQGETHWLNWHALAGMGTEDRLQILCGWILTAHDDGMEYGLILPGLELPVGSGESHKHTCLEALALYGINEPAIKKQVVRNAK